MVIQRSKGFSSKGKNTTNVIKLDDYRPKYVEWPMSKKIKVGKASDGYLILQALQPVFDEGWSLHITKGESESIAVQIMKPQGKVYRYGEGPSFSVALRRATVGMSKDFSHMQE
jgi:hypothetical protein